MSILIERTRADGSIIDIAITEVADGDFRIDAEPAGLADRRSSVMDGEWVVVRQVHGSNVVDAATVVSDGLAPNDAPNADAITTEVSGVPIAVQGADCAPLAFVTDGGPIAVAHAGWRGLAAGVISSVVEVLAEDGVVVTEVVVGPVIGPECYEFGAEDLDEVARTLGDSVRSETSAGTPALDLRSAISTACAGVGIATVTFAGSCTACSGGGFSHRSRRDGERHALVARIRP